LQGNGLYFDRVTEADTGIYTCYLDNFVQPVVSYKFSLMVEGQSVNPSSVSYIYFRQTNTHRKRKHHKYNKMLSYRRETALQGAL